MDPRQSKPNGVRPPTTSGGAVASSSSNTQHNLAYSHSLVDTSAEDANDTQDALAQMTYTPYGQQQAEWYRQARGNLNSINSAEEEEDLRVAVEKSLNANSELSPWYGCDAPNRSVTEVVHSLEQRVPPSQRVPPKQRVQDQKEQEKIEASLLCMSNDFDWFQDPEGDTLIYIGPPPKAADESPGDYAYILSVFSKFHRVKSSTLRELGSRRINDSLGPRSVRVERRFRKEELLQNVDITGIKYYVDWRPPNEDDEAITLVLDLTCSNGILRWHSAQDYYQIPKGKVMGKDTFAPLLDFTTPVASAKKSKAARDWDNAPSGKSDPVATPSVDVAKDKVVAAVPIVLEPEYSALRHRTGLLRLLHAIHGHDPRLDSASKCWTFFALAQFFKIATHDRISGWIRNWILYYNNDNFIQCNPEAAFRIGLGIEDPFLTRLAFSLLVGEKALMNIAAESDPTLLRNAQHSQHGRTFASLDDNDLTCIDHAANALVHRIRSFCDSLVLGDMAWLKMCGEYNTLLDFQPQNEEQRLMQEEGINLVQDYIRGRIYWLLCRFHVTQLKGQTFRLKSATDFMPGLPAEFYMAFNNFGPSMRIFTRTFWISLAQTEFQVGTSNTCDGTDLNLNFHDRWNPASRYLQDLYDENPQKGIKDIPYIDLVKFGRKLDDALKVKSSGYQQVSAQDSVPTAVTFQSGTNGPTTTPTRLDLTGLGSSTATSVRPLVESAGQSPKHTTDTGVHARSLPKRRKLSVENDITRLIESSSAQHTQLPFRSHEGDLSSLRLDGPGASEPLSKEDAILSHLEQELLLEREYALKLEVEHVVRMLGQTDFTVEESKDLFDMFTPIYQQTSSFGKVIYTGFIDKTRPIAKPLRVYHSPSDLTRVPIVVHEQAEPVSPSTIQPPSSSSANQPTLPSAPRHQPTTNSGWSSDEDNKFTTPHPILSQPNLYFDINKLLTEASRSLQSILEPFLQPAHLFHDGTFIPIDLTDTLVCLDDASEFKFLPLWAGGLNDGTAGVFNEVDIPDLERGGFRGGKRGISNVTGYSAPSTFGSGYDSASVTDDSFSDIGSEAQGTTARASHFAARDHDGDTVFDYASVSDSTENGGRPFPGQQEIYDEIQRIKLEKEREDAERKGKGKGRAREGLTLTSLSLRQPGAGVESDGVLVDRTNDTNPTGAVDMDEDQVDDDEDDDDGETSTIQGAGGSSDEFVDFDDDSGNDHVDKNHDKENQHGTENDLQQTQSNQQDETQGDEEWEEI